MKPCCNGSQLTKITMCKFAIAVATGKIGTGHQGNTTVSMILQGQTGHTPITAGYVSATNVRKGADMNNWRPIETHPRSRAATLLWDGDWVRLGWWDQKDDPNYPWHVETYFSHDSSNLAEDAITHWMPIPDGPGKD